MKTIYSPDTANAWIEAGREIAIANPAVAFALGVVLVAAFATWATKNF